MNWLWIVLIAVIGLLAYIRHAPSDATRWHVLDEVSNDKDFAGGILRVVPSGTDGLATLDNIIQATERTSILAGSVDAGMVTYITRSKIFGFPDYTTVRQTDSGLAIYARLRFGRSDIGVNRARVNKWLALGKFK